MRQYISGGKEYNTKERHVNAPIFRKVFSCNKDDLKHAEIEISSSGFYRLFLNGKELTKGFFAPYISNPDHIIYFDRYDIKEYLEETNVLCIVLGNGFGNSLDGNVWEFESAAYRSSPKVYARVMANGQEILTTDESFEVFDSAITFDDYRCGERFDARLANKRIFMLDYMEKGRPALCVSEPKGEYKQCMAEPIKSFEILYPVSIAKSEGGYIYDFGQNNAGLCRLKITGQEGQLVKLTYGECVRDGKLDLYNILYPNISTPEYIQHDEYICVEGEQEYLPSFTYHGFRYVYVEGITEEQAVEELLEFVVIHSDIWQRGMFRCSDSVVNKIQECVLRSDVSNFHYFPTDCPQREKNGWTADVALSTEQLLYNFDCVASLREWLHNVRKAQNQEGALPGIVPTGGFGFEWGNGPGWDCVLIELPYQLYRFTEDKTIIIENADSIKRYFNYLQTKRNENGLISFGLGDWSETKSAASDCYTTPLEVTDTLVCVDIATKAAHLLTEIGADKDAKQITEFGEELKRIFREKYVSEGVVICRTQTAQAQAIRYGIFNEGELPKAYETMKELLAEQDGHFHVGVLGAKVLFDVLTDIGEADAALYSIVRSDFPSYGYMITRGATTLWERIDELADDNIYCRKDGGRPGSYNHHFWGGVSAWFYRVLGGIHVIGNGRVTISPIPVQKIEWAEAEYKEKDKSIYVCWKRQGRDIYVTVDNRGFTGEIEIKGYICGNGEEKIELSNGKNTFCFCQARG